MSRFAQLAPRQAATTWTGRLVVLLEPHDPRHAMYYLAVTLLIAILVIAWLLTFLSLPGNWIMVLALAIFAYWSADHPEHGVSWQVVVAAAILALVGEAVEFAASALGATRAGGSRRSALLAMVGSMVGGVSGMLLGAPVPVIGSLVAAVLGACVGALAGAALGEQWKGGDLNASLRVGHGAFWGRMFGTLAKTGVGLAIMLVSVTAALV